MRKQTLWGIGRLLLVSVYSIVLLVIDALHFEGQVGWAIGVIATVLWLVILVDFWVGLARATDKKTQLRQHLGYPILLLAPLLLIPFVTPILTVALLVAYILELRQVTAGEGFAFSAALVAFVAVGATWALAYSESKDPESSLGEWGSAGLWTVANILRIHSSGEPTTHDGQFVSYVLGVCALLVAGLFTAQLVAWVTGSRKKDDEEREEVTRQLADDVAALRTAVEELTARLDRERS